MLSGQFLTPVSDLVELVAPQEDYLWSFSSRGMFPGCLSKYGLGRENRGKPDSHVVSLQSIDYKELARYLVTEVFHFDMQSELGFKRKHDIVCCGGAIFPT